MEFDSLFSIGFRGVTWTIWLIGVYAYLFKWVDSSYWFDYDGPYDRIDFAFLVDIDEFRDDYLPLIIEDASKLLWSCYYNIKSNFLALSFNWGLLGVMNLVKEFKSITSF